MVAMCCGYQPNYVMYGIIITQYKLITGKAHKIFGLIYLSSSGSGPVVTQRKLFISPVYLYSLQVWIPLYLIKNTASHKADFE